MAMRPSPLFSIVIRLCIAVLYLLESASVSSGIGEVCILGSTEVTETNFLDIGGQYLDFGHPAPCTGNLTAWHFCYYAADISLDFLGRVRDYVVEFRVWRTVDGNTFNRVHDHRITMAIAPPSNGQTLICETATLSTPLEVLTNDILGVYVFTTNTLGRPLHIIARDTSDFGVRFDTRDNGSPDFIPFNSETVNINDLENRTTLGLHLYADIATNCDDLSDPVNGQVLVTPDAMATADTDLCAVAVYTCNDGYNLVGDVMRTCQASGQWDGAEPTCMLIDCGGLNNPSDGQVTITPGLVAMTGEGAMATYTCSEGYSLIDGTVRTCQDDGQWDGAEPTCMLIDCGGLANPSNGQVAITPGSVAMTGEGAMATYNCSEGHSLSDGAVRTCQADGQWDGAEPTCMSAQRQNSGPIIGGVVVALLVAALVALGFVLAVIFRRRQKRRDGVNIQISSHDNSFKDLSNPVYSATADEKAFDDSVQVTDGKSYEMIGTSRPLGTFTSTTSDYNEIDDPYPSSDQEIPERRNIYNTMSDSTLQWAIASSYEEPVPTPRNSYQLGIHVPTQAQREALTQSGSGEGSTSAGASGAQENIYTALIEVQRTMAPTMSLASMTFFEETDTYWAPSSNPSELYEQLAVKKYREIPRNQIQIVEHLGAGQFGTVNKGTWQSTKTVEVAIKMLKARAGEIDKVKFLQEAAINGQFRHPNIVKLLGVVTVGEPAMIVLEFLANGDLRNYLIKQRPVPGELLPSWIPRTFLGFCQQVASGMEYLSRKAFVHRDLAARNVLVSENKTCKISDFGMSRDLMDESYYVSQGGKIPVKWTAPEAIHFKKYTTASDVWSYGAVMYEIWSLGHKPFDGYTNQKAIELVDSGYRLPPPPGCPKKLYSVTMQCWHPQKSSRPSFLQIVEALSEPELELLCWTAEDVKVHPQAVVLGAPLDAGRALYPELQGIYNQ